MKKTAKEKNIKGKNIKESKKKKHTFRNIVLLLLLIILIAAGVFAYKVHINGGGIQGILKTSLGHDEETINNLDKIYCLVLGQSQNLTDTIMIASYDPKTQEAALLSIPRDTFVGYDKDYASGYDKINAVYQTGVDNLLEDVRNITGIDVQYYLKVDTEALKALVDEIGGVYFNVPIDMHYTDRKQGLYIDLQAGEQLLDGDKAEQVVRFRHNSDGSTYPSDYGGEDLGRMRTQRDFLKALLEQSIENMDVNMILDFLDIAKQYVETNLDFEAIKDYVPYVLDFNINNLKTDTLPGVPEQAAYTGTWIYTVNEEEAKEVIDQLFYGKEPVVDSDGNTIEDENSIDGNTTSELNTSSLEIEVLNGSGNTSKANEVIQELEAAGYDVEDKGNTTTTNNTAIIKRSDIDTQEETDLKEILGVDNILSSDSSGSDITVIIGTDYII